MYSYFFQVSRYCCVTDKTKDKFIQPNAFIIFLICRDENFQKLQSHEEKNVFFSVFWGKWKILGKNRSQVFDYTILHIIIKDGQNYTTICPVVCAGFVIVNFDILSID